MINVETADAVGLIELDRQERRNALDLEHCEALRDAVTRTVAEGARALVVSGAGTSFCSGADFGQVYGDGFRTALYAALHALTDAPVPVIAAVNGPAIGAGTQLAIACDLRVVADEAVFAVPTARIGLAVDPWTVRRLALLAGGGAARAMLLGCDQLDAQRAHGLGLADRLGDRDAAVAWATSIASLAPLSLSYSKRALTDLFEPGTDATDATGLFEAFEACWTSEDVAESKRARAEQRSPRFSGR
ncbi:MAG: enoyl-CoA hydratase [Pseudonocardiaceae bacterium]|nr:enoyl-CoA hydratase [Pseudonocardiaceae bacterium]